MLSVWTRAQKRSGVTRWLLAAVLLGVIAFVFARAHTRLVGAVSLQEKKADRISPAAALTVTTAVDEDGTNPAKCSLREAITAANTNHSYGGCPAGVSFAPDSIIFDIGSAPTIFISPLLGKLPNISGPVLIDGGTGGATRVEINGSSAGPVGGLIIATAGGGSTIRSLMITHFLFGIGVDTSDGNAVENCIVDLNSSDGIQLAGSSNNVIGGASPGTGNIIIRSGGAGVGVFQSSTSQVQGNFIGTDAASTPGLGNATGVLIENGSAVTVGGTVAGARNVISGNSFDGITIQVFSKGNEIKGNYIGTTVNGMAPLKNNFSGVAIIGSSATNNTIGGTEAAARNLISGNGTQGIYINATSNIVAGNYIGTAADGLTAIPNGANGVEINSAGGNTIGGPGASARNIISGNTNGVYIHETDSQNNEVLNNYIGLDRLGTTGVPNVNFGVLIQFANNNRIGGATGGNVVSGSGTGVGISNATGTQVQGNIIGTNAAGTTAMPNGYGVSLNDANGTIVGGTDPRERNIISGNSQDGIQIRGFSIALGQNNTVKGNYIGTSADGASPLKNNGSGISIVGDFATNNLIGGPESGARNIISGNGAQGIYLRAPTNVVQGNYIGTNVSGTVALPNDQNGVRVDGVTSETIGGTANGAGNLISGNRLNGVSIEGASGSNLIKGNFIGTNANGTAAVGNQSAGIFVTGTSAGMSNVIGSDVFEAGARNVISGNGTHGVYLDSERSFVRGNYIGTAVNGTTALGNTLDGVYSATPGTIIGAGSVENINVIAFNGRNGITVTRAASMNSIRDNVIHSNGALGIDLAPPDGSANPIFGVTANDPGDADSGPNGLQNYPVLAKAFGYTSGSSSFIRVQGTLDAKGNDDYLVQIYQNPSCDPSGFGEGRTLLGQFAISVAPGGGVVSFDRTLIASGIAFSTGDAITATATSINGKGETSEFSACIPLLAPTLAINDVSGAEGNSGTVPANFTVTLTGAIGVTDPITVNYATANGTATAGSDYATANGTVTFNPPFTQNTITQAVPVQVIGDTTIEPNETFFVNLTGNVNATLIKSQGVGTILDDDANVAQFSSSNYNVVEDCTTVTITVNRLGDTSGAASVNYATSDVTASERRDYITALGKLTFAPGETSKSFVVLINEDSYVEGNETFNVTLSNPTGVGLGAPAIATVTITDDPSEPASNVIDDPQNFVCQHYHDFLNRQPDPGGLAFWTNEITSCGADQPCIDLKRINVSAAFYLSIEFRETGYLVERIYKASYGNVNGASTFGGIHQLPVPIVRLNEFLLDTQQIGQGVVVGQTGWETLLENNKQAFAAEFVQRSRFTTAFPNSMTPAQFVDTLNAKAGNPLSPSERDQLVNDLSTNAKARAQVLRAVAEDSDLNSAESNRAFVLMQYLGYLRRNPNDPPDTDYTGYDFWLTKLDQFNGNFVNADMVKAFITSGEYRNRFKP